MRGSGPPGALLPLDRTTFPGLHTSTARSPLAFEYTPAAHRTKRPWQGAVEPPQLASLPSYDDKCYLCPGNARAGGARTEKYAGTFVFENDFAALLPDKVASPEPAHPDEAVASLFRTEPARGKCFVICFSPRHDLTIAEMQFADVERVVETWCVHPAEACSPLPVLGGLG